MHEKKGKKKIVLHNLGGYQGSGNRAGTSSFLRVIQLNKQTPKRAAQSKPHFMAQIMKDKAKQNLPLTFFSLNKRAVSSDDL